MLNEISVKCFLTVYETLNFTEAARRLFMTQQAVSKYIASMEEDLGYRLFLRTHRYVRRTQAAENFYRMFTSFGEQFEAMMEETRSYYSDTFQVLRVGYLEWLDLSPGLGEAVRSLRQKYPKVEFVGEKRSQEELNTLFAENKLDLLVTYREFAPSGYGIKSICVMETPLVLLVAQDHPLAGPDAKAETFSGETFIKAAGTNENYADSVRRAKHQVDLLGFSPSEIRITPNLESAYMAAELGQGVLVSTMLSRMTLGGSLKWYPLGINEELLCVWHEEDENPLRQEFAQNLIRSQGG